MTNKSKKDPMSKETLTSKEEMEAAKGFSWEKLRAKRLKIEKRGEAEKEMTGMERDWADAWIFSWGKTHEEVFDEKTKSRKEWDATLKEAKEMKIEDKRKIEARLGEQIAKRDKFFNASIRALEKNPDEFKGVLGGSQEDLEKLYRGRKLDSEESKLWKEWPLPLRAAKITEQLEDIERRRGVIRNKFQAKTGPELNDYNISLFVSIQGGENIGKSLDTLAGRMRFEEIEDPRKSAIEKFNRLIGTKGTERAVRKLGWREFI